MALLAVSVVLHAPRAPASAPAGELYDIRPDQSRTVPDRVSDRARGGHHQVVPLQRHILRLRPYSQNIRTRLPTGGYALTLIYAWACLLLPSHPYSVSRGTAKAEGGGDGLETPVGVYNGDRRSRAPVAQ